AVLAGTTHASVSSVLIIFELTGDYDLILPLMLTAVLAAAVSRKLQPESLYTAILRKRNVPLPSTAPGWLRAGGVRAVLDPDVHTVAPDASFDEVVLALLELPPGAGLFVATADRRLLGAIHLDAVKGQLPEHQLIRRSL